MLDLGGLGAHFPQMTSSIVVIPKRHFLARKHVVWSIKRENRSTGSTWAQDRQKGQDRTGQSKVTKALYFTYFGRTPTERIFTKICMVVAVPDVITCGNIWAEIFRGYDFTGGRISCFPIDSFMGLTTVQRYCAACDLTLLHSKAVVLCEIAHNDSHLAVKDHSKCILIPIPIQSPYATWYSLSSSCRGVLVKLSLLRDGASI